MADSEKIVCKPTPWFLWRAIAMMGMFFGFAGWFAYDGLIGYPKKNQIYYLHKNFEKAGEVFKEKLKTGGLTEESWKEYVSTQKVEYPEEAKGIIPKNTDMNQPWPKELEDYQLLKDENAETVWLRYTGGRKMNSETLPKPHDSESMRTQLILTGTTAVLGLLAFFFLFRTMGRKMVVDAEAFYPACGKKILYSSMRQLDKRRWENKGLASIMYEENGEQKKAKVDGLTYGGFKEEQNAPAERLFEKIVANFKGEIVEYIAVDDDNEESSKEGGST